ncbi:sigma factor-like helix-turn-helix DNA-binding protein [Nocardioides aquiterrae]|uniref:RNA polymerase sigma factor 70 region 4 type 2 domain-containing protein n=1 Tax=Nocardioides aquiterrae TaxID=203799 RepID=A0ABN1UB11_9ACTN
MSTHIERNAQSLDPAEATKLKAWLSHCSAFSHDERLAPLTLLLSHKVSEARWSRPGEVPLTARWLLTIADSVTGSRQSRDYLCGAVFDHVCDSVTSDHDVTEQMQVDPRTRLRAARAWSELTELEQTRSALLATEDGMAQREIARLLGVSQTEVHRMLRRARTVSRDWFATTPRELILEYNAGIISRGMLVGRLGGVAEGAGGPGELDDGYKPDSWDEVRDAYLDGLLTEEEYEELRAKSSQRRDSEGRHAVSETGQTEDQVRAAQ